LTQIAYQNKHYNIDQKDEGTWDDRGRDGGTNFILRIKEQETRLTVREHDDDNDDEVLKGESRGKLSGRLRSLINCHKEPQKKRSLRLNKSVIFYTL